MGRSASGVRGIKLVPGDAVVGAAHPAADDDRLLVVQAKGAAKRVMMSEIPVQGRGTKGVRCAVVTPRSGQVIAVCGTTDASTVLVRDADGAIAEVSVGAFAAAARDASGGKVRGFDGVITGFETI
jgi:DNA gyrase subunit A